MKYLLALLLCCLAGLSQAQEFTAHFEEQTLRLDYIFAGNEHSQSVVLDELIRLPQWAGRHKNLSALPLQGNGQIAVIDPNSHRVLYRTSFSTLFQEWQSTAEAKQVDKSFENTFLVPFPKHKVQIEVALFDEKGVKRVLLTHIVDPHDVLIRQRGFSNRTPHQLIHRATNAQAAIHVAFVAEGFTAEEMDVFNAKAKTAMEQILAHQPFAQYADRFNFYAVQSPSTDSGVSVPRQGDWKLTAVDSHFDSFYSERYLTTSRVKRLHDILAGIPYEHIVILANTDVYGGGGIFNSYTLTTTGNPQFKPVVVHEFGHSFAGLADEYFYENDVLSDLQSVQREPWEQNITSLVDFDSKWKDKLKKGTPVPTPLAEQTKYPLGVYEGLPGLGIYKPSADCRMRTNTAAHFCPVCKSAIASLIEFYTQ